MEYLIVLITMGLIVLLIVKAKRIHNVKCVECRHSRDQGSGMSDVPIGKWLKCIRLGYYGIEHDRRRACKHFYQR